MLMTSLNEIKSFNPCVSGWEDILIGQSQKTSDGVLFPLVDAVNSNSISDVCWLIGKRQKELQILVKFAEMCSSDAARHASDAARYASYAARYASDAARHASDAARYASYAARHASDAARHASDAARYASDAARHASYAARYASDASDASPSARSSACEKQNQKNKQNLIQCINEYKA